MDWSALAASLAVPLMVVTIGLAWGVILVTIMLVVRNRGKPGQWVNLLEIAGCIYMTWFYVSKLLGMSPYAPLGLVEGILPITILLLVAIWHRAYEICSWDN